MIIGLFGASSTGKTTITRRVAPELTLPLRLCGEIVKSRSVGLGVSLMQLSDEDHQNIDSETREWAIKNKPCIIEGRYLDQVLYPMGAQVALIRLEANTADRRMRSLRSGSDPLTIMGEDPDLLDSMFRARMYRGVEHLIPQLTLSSSELSVEACAQRVIDFVQRVHPVLG